MRHLPAALVAFALFLLPFEAWLPLLNLPGMRVSNLELALAAAVLAWVVRGLWPAVASKTLTPSLSRRERGMEERASLRWPTLAVLAAAWLSAVRPLGPQVEAIKVAGRLTMGALFGGAVAATLREPRGRWLVPAALVAGATLSAGLGLLEMAGIAAVADWLAWFKDGPAGLGPTTRLSATFGSANTAAMLFAPALCLTLGLVLADRRTRPVTRLAPALAAVLLSVALALTYSRGGMAAGVVGVAAMLLVGGRRVWPRLLPLLGAAALGVAVVVLADPVLRARLAVWNSRPLDGAVINAPRDLVAGGGATQHIPLRVTNAGRVTWQATGDAAWRVGYHWLDADGETLLVWGAADAPLPHAVTPGESVNLNLAVTTPSAGHYWLAWDVLQPSGDWLGARQPLVARTTLTVTGAGGEPLPRQWAATLPTPPPGRDDLWRAALALAWQRPLLGVGMGGFRHLYGLPLGLAEWDTRILANSLYFEILADGGLVSGVAWGWLLVAAVAAAWQGARRGDPLALGVLGALLAWLAHGLVDVGLETTAIYALFWTLVGMAGAWGPGRVPENGSHTGN